MAFAKSRVTVIYLIIFLSSFFFVDADWLVTNPDKPIKQHCKIATLCADKGANSASCKKIDLNLAKKICGGDKLEVVHYGNFTYNNVTGVKCNGATCHLDVMTDYPEFHTGCDCVQKQGDDVECTCFGYGDSTFMNDPENQIDFPVW